MMRRVASGIWWPKRAQSNAEEAVRTWTEKSQREQAVWGPPAKKLDLAGVHAMLMITDPLYGRRPWQTGICAVV